ncbi:MAG: methyltransferase domain-containing protein [Lewinella sp.]|jgi:2-polyprenyl-3-methyl-5-hydroxy-6-metoxy-1,4-benzoquinol methylase|uniref:class I SAM-dependent methyltransferase n=1 Tax=Lewinella sp. TaxID=2004506 RepID=UPI003D6AE21D
MPGSLSDKILSSWQANSQSWITTIDQSEIVSRQLATNDAIVNAIEKHHPFRILDIGCGEGWLSRAIYAPHRIVIGIDGVKELVSNATKKGGGPAYACFNYEDIRQGKLPSWEPFDLIVFNFALFEDGATFTLLNQLKQLLVPRGHLLVQTIALPAHEFSGWRTEDWRSMKTNYPAPFPWYYRERDEWKKDAQQNDWKIHRLTDVLHPENKQLLSWIIELQAAF